ncbi:MAG: hypothetical protein AVDCRST_MAG44-1677 [uncultured Sphingomonas sp.]|uniref:FAS1 domain-containing protein n=1 Tax=uncultured Sphingomonas sp. TaxID=158754 RepID=A0A6J4T6Z6_9SPHN|nr:MAG: hypothetical protein AVDCRST_MAG44-1677 [uncultured Sphingomonas sp.]
MKTHALTAGLVAAVLTVGGCNNENSGNASAGSAQTPKAQEVAGSKTIAAGLTTSSRFMGAAKAAGLDQTLAGPGPYTVLAPSDQAFAAAPAGAFDAKPENRAQITGVLTNLILPGTVLAADIDKAIERGKGKAPLATMGGGTITASKEGGRIVLTDASGKKAAISQADQQFSNGVVHQIDGLLLPGQQQAPGTPAPAQPKGQ